MQRITCFLCGKEGRSPPLQRCSQCDIAYYCSKTCQRGHWKKHKAACIAAVAAKADDARRERLARAVREKGKDKVEGGDDDALCVICLGPPTDPIQVRGGMGGGFAGFMCRTIENYHLRTKFDLLSLCFGWMPHHTAALRSRVLQVVHGTAARKGGRPDMPPVSQTPAARPGQAV